MVAIRTFFCLPVINLQSSKYEPCIFVTCSFFWELVPQWLLLLMGTLTCIISCLHSFIICLFIQQHSTKWTFIFSYPTILQTFMFFSTFFRVPLPKNRLPRLSPSYSDESPLIRLISSVPTVNSLVWSKLLQLLITKLPVLTPMAFPTHP